MAPTGSLQAPAVRVGVTGAVYSAAVGSARPANATDVLDAAYANLGYVSEDGVTESYDETIERIIAWQNATVVRASTTESTAQLSMTLIETKGSVLEVYHKGSQVEAIGAGQWKIDVKAAAADPRAWIVDVIDGAKHIRIDVGNGEVEERGEIVYANGEAVGYNITITCYPDENGVLFTKFSDDANWGYS